MFYPAWPWRLASKILPKGLGGRKRTSAPKRRACLFLEPLEELVLLNGTVTWINTAGGDWDTAANWKDQNGVHRVPGSTDDAIINVSGGVSVTHNQATADTVASLTLSDPFTLSAGTLDVTGKLSSSTTFTLQSATLAQANVQAGTTITSQPRPVALRRGFGSPLSHRPHSLK